MGDLQIFAGISILISGYIQLPCGLSCYHWQVIVYLAWFSTLTHLSCLTFLRARLHQRPTERAWRVAAMLIVVLLLIVAIVPTGNFNWFTDMGPETESTPSDYVACHFVQSRSSDKITYASMVISILLLGIGFATRVVRLFEPLSVCEVNARIFLSRRIRDKILQPLFISMVVKQEGATKLRHRWKQLLVYRPILVLFLTFELGVDIWNSMVFEVCMESKNCVYC